MFAILHARGMFVADLRDRGDYYRQVVSTPTSTSQYYADLFAGRLGFEVMRTFKVYPSIFGVTINDDAAELSFRLFDHPWSFVFRRTTADGA